MAEKSSSTNFGVGAAPKSLSKYTTIWDRTVQVTTGTPTSSTYSGDLNTYFFEVWISNGPVFKWMVYGLCFKTNIWIPDQYISIRKKMASICLVAKWLGCLVFKWDLKTRLRIWHPTSFWPFKYQTSSVFRSLLYLPGWIPVSCTAYISQKGQNMFEIETEEVPGVVGGAGVG